MWKMPIGIDDFKTIRDEGYYFVDKTDFIRQLIDGHSAVTLITRPRRFGKTLTMSMLDYFFSIEKEVQSRHLFDGLAIAKAAPQYMQAHGQYPVVFLSLKDFSCRSWQEMLDIWADYLQDLFLQHAQLRDSQRVQAELIDKFQVIVGKKANTASLARSLSLLLTMMRQYYGKKVIVLIDEYDAPLQLAWENGFYADAIAFMKQFLGSVLKGNASLEFSVLTGVLRVAKESIFSDLNNLDVCSVMDWEYQDVIGFTPQEVEKMAADLEMKSYLPALKEWYDGYRFGGAEIYNPWSVINFFRRREVGDYWVNTSGNSIIREMLRHVTAETERALTSLLHGQSITALIREGLIYEDIGRDTDALYTMLLTTGYLTAVSRRRGIGGLRCELVIPNEEVRHVFQRELLNRKKEGLPH